MPKNFGFKRLAGFVLALALVLGPFQGLQAVPAQAEAATVIVDNGGGGYYESAAGAWTNSNLKGYLNSGTRFTDNASSLNIYVLYIPDLPQGGIYDVSIYKIAEASSDPNARIEVAHSDGTEALSMDQSTGSSGWQELGSYHFSSGTNGYVKLSLGTLNKRLRADAVKFTLVAADAEQTVSLYPAADTYVNGGAKAADNYGSAAELLVKKDADIYTRQTYIKFNENAYNGPVGSAVLYVYGAVTDPAGTETDVQVFSTDDTSWEEQTLTWNLPRPQPFDYIGKLHVQSANQEYKWYGIDVTSYVRAKTRANEPLQFTLLQEDKGLLVRLKSKENLTHKPYLSISPSYPAQPAAFWPSDSILAADNSGDETSAALAWTPALEAEQAIDGYRIYKNGVLLDTVSSTVYQYNAAGLSMDTLYTFKVEAVNAAGAESRDGPMQTVRTGKIGIGQIKPGNVFLESENVQFKIETNRETISWSVKNIWEETVAEGVYANQGTEVLLELDPGQTGYFLLEADLDSPGRTTATLRTPFAVLPDANPGQSLDARFGMNTHFASSATGWSPDLSPLAKAAGAGSIRDGYYWASVETQTGQYDYSKYAPYMSQIGEDGILPLIMLGLENPLYDGGSTPYSEAGFQAYADYAVASLAQFGSQITAVEIYNEFNLPGYGDRGNGPADSKPEVYAGMLQKSYEAIKAVRPDVTVVGLAAAGVPLDWIEEVFQLGGLQYMDAISIHPYQYPRVPEAMVTELTALKNLIKQYNGGQLKPIWSTEIGWPTHEGSTNEKTQADYLVRSYIVSFANGMDRVYWYDFMNDGTDKTYNENNFGVIRNLKDSLGAYTPKPAYAAFAAITRQLAGWDYDRADNFAPDISSYVFQKGGVETRAVWAQREMTVALDVYAPVEVTDLMGNTQTYVPQQGKVYLTLDGEPRYVKGFVLGMQEDATYALTGERVLVGEPAQLLLKVSNAGQSGITAAAVVGGIPNPFYAAPGQEMELTIAGSSFHSEGKHRISGYLLGEAGVYGRLEVQLDVDRSSQVRMWPVTDAAGEQKALRLHYANYSSTLTMETGAIQWTMNGSSGIAHPGIILAPGAEANYDLVLPGQWENGISYDARVQAELAGTEPYIYEGMLDFNPIPFGSITIDGVTDPREEPPTADLSKGTVHISGYGGENDLGGYAALSWDENCLYLTADIADDVFEHSFSGAEIYKNDSLQFALAADLPGLSKEWYEYGLSLTPSGPQIYRWLAPAGLADGDLTARGNLAVHRDELAQRTVYELALPWSEIPTIDRTGEGMTFSLLVNDNDGVGRKGFIEWGSGIGTEKTQAKFKTVQWLRPGEAE